MGVKTCQRVVFSKVYIICQLIIRSIYHSNLVNGLQLDGNNFHKYV